MTQDQLHHIFVEVHGGRGMHGSFLRAFADCYLKADLLNKEILHKAAEVLVSKYRLSEYLDKHKESK